MSRTLTSALCALLLPAALAAQDFGDNRCVMRVDSVGRYRQIDRPGNLTFYAGGGVHLSCIGTTVRMRSDSLMAIDNFRVAYFIGDVRYSDSTMVTTAERGTYYKQGERWEARGNVVAKNTRTNSTLTGPALDYLRPIPGVRDSVEMYAVGRPRIEYIPSDSAGRAQEPYIINGDRVRFRGNDQIFAGGHVTVDRSDFGATSDSLRLDTGGGQNGALVGNAKMEGKGGDPYSLAGRRIDLRLKSNALSGLRAMMGGQAVTTEWDLVADTIDLALANRQLVQTLAWGDSIRPRALNPEREIRADSLAIDTPDRRPTEARAFGQAWVGAKPDSGSAERDWLSGDTVVAGFAPTDSGPSRNVLRSVEAKGHARSYYRVSDRSRVGPPSISYVRGDFIVVRMRTSGAYDVEQVDVRGQVDGVQLEPARQRPDTTRSEPASTTPASSRPGGVR